MTDDEMFDDDEAALVLELGERRLAFDKAEQCSDPELRRAAMCYLMEEEVQSAARLWEEILAAADAGEITLTDEARQDLLEGIAMAVDRPDWYEPGYRVVLPQEES
jgi:hypothetical protein